MNSKPLAIFILGGSASGKSSFVRDEYIGTLDAPDAEAYIKPVDGFCIERWLDSDRVKHEIPLYTDEIGNADAQKRFGRPDLGGPSGPRTLHEYYKYPEDARKNFEKFLFDRTGYASVEQFIEKHFDDPERDPNDLGNGLTHELSKFLAHGLLEDALSEMPPRGNVIWDACGRIESYWHWIEMALEHGYHVELESPTYFKLPCQEFQRFQCLVAA